MLIHDIHGWDKKNIRLVADKCADAGMPLVQHLYQSICPILWLALWYKCDAEQSSNAYEHLDHFQGRTSDLQALLRLYLTSTMERSCPPTSPRLWNSLACSL